MGLERWSDMSEIAQPAMPEGAAVGRQARRYASYVFWVMFSINLFNYLDRYVLPAVLSSIQSQFRLTDTQSGALGTAFLLVYAVGALPLSIWADRGIRKNVVGLCVGIWSVATFLSGLATGFWTLFVARALVGIGEAGYYPAGTSLLSDYFPRERRAQVMSRWGAGSLVGLAVGFSLGGIIAGALSWRAAFFLTAVPGLLFAFLAWRLREPVRGISDGWQIGAEAERGERILATRLPFTRQLGMILGTPTIVVTILVQIFGFWVLGAAAYWLPIYLQREYGFSVGEAGVVSGAVLVVAGVTGILAGGMLADALTRRWKGGRVLAAGIGFLLSAPCFALAVTSSGFLVFLPFFILSGLLLNVYSGPITAISQDVMVPELRALTISVSLLIAHLLGDVSSPLIVGALSDALGGHAPGLREALLYTCPALLALAGVIGILGARFVQRDLAGIEERRLARVA
jgi:MFS family permease